MTHLEERALRFGLGTPTGTLYVFSRSIARELRAHGVATTAIETRGPVDNLDLLERHELSLGGVPTAELYRRRERPRGSTGVSVLFPLFKTQLQFIVPMSSDISSWSDVRGKRINIGQKGFSGPDVVYEILGKLGIHAGDFAPAYLTHDVAGDELIEGRLDGLIAPGAAPHPAIVKLSGRSPIRIVPLSSDDLVQALAIPYLSATVVPPVYAGVTQPVTTVGEWYVLACRDDFDEELGRWLTERWWRGRDELVRLHRAAEELPAPAEWHSPVAVHKGAQDFYRSVRAHGEDGN